MKSIHGVGELMTQVVLRGGGLLPTTPTHQPEGDVVKTQTEPEREDIMVMDTKLKIIEILQARHQDHYHYYFLKILRLYCNFYLFYSVHFERSARLQDLLPSLYFQTRI